MTASKNKKDSKNSLRVALKKDWQKNKTLYFMAIPIILYYLIFHYAPMGGLIIGFKNYRPGLGLWDSPWAANGGFEHFIDFFTSYDCWRLIRNTVTISLSNIIIGFPIPIILALLLHELKSERFKKSVQTITYMPHFISTVVVCGIIIDLVGTKGVITKFFEMFGYQGGNLLGVPEFFVSLFVGSNIWQHMGWGAIIYIAALSGVSQELYEAARIDGANRWQQLLNVTLPGIAPTITIMLIMRLGNVMTVFVFFIWIENYF